MPYVSRGNRRPAGTSESARNRDGPPGVDISTLLPDSSQPRDCSRRSPLALGLQLEVDVVVATWRWRMIDVPQRGIGENRMDTDYIFLCGVMWCRFGEQEAGRELLRAADSMDPDTSALAWAMLAKGASRFSEFGKTGTDLFF